MWLNLKICRIGDSLGVALPEEVLARLKVKEGDSLCLTEGPNGDFRLVASNPEVIRQMGIAEDIMNRYGHALRELAK